MSFYKSIVSVSNELVKEMVHLKQSSFRKEKKLFIAEGIRVIKTILENQIELRYCFFTKTNENVVQLLNIPMHNLIMVSDQVIQKMSSMQTSPGVIAVFVQPSWELYHTRVPGVVFDHISDPGNMGTLIRTATACDLSVIYVIEGVDPWSNKVIQSSAGTIGQVPIISVTWDYLFANTKKNNIMLNALVINGTCTFVKNKKQLLIIGNEAHGISSDVLYNCDILTTIPMPGKTESLNAAAAGSIALYNTFIL